MNNNKISKLRLEASRLIKERGYKEKIIFERTVMVAASLIQKPSGAYYLSASIAGESRHRYVRKDKEEYWKKRAQEWRNFSKALIGWVQLNKEIESKFREIGRLRCENLPGGEKGEKKNGPS